MTAIEVHCPACNAEPYEMCRAEITHSDRFRAADLEAEASLMILSASGFGPVEMQQRA